ncbi:uncharacterized protein LOC110719195 [Chenopodium quinoa]|uniref:uncharacterized protein LOC110719195 n=1 Tax=Chenopodium quinoa TaxID=63459 RepID=UPI000B775DF2|nr:uncharacterized protein LOC110719195 [Chenopodium quinoa]
MKSKVTLKTNPGQSSKKNAQPASSSDTDQEPIYTIAGGFVGGGPTIRGTKDHDRGKVRRPNDDPIVIECKVANQKVDRILIDTGSSSDLISYKCLSKPKYKPGSMHKVSHPLVGFGGRVVHPVGRIDLPIWLGEKGEGCHMVVQFLVLEELTAYNIILGRPTLNASKVVIIPSLMLLKFEKDDGSIGSLNGDQKTAREWYLSDVKPTVAAAGHGEEPVDLDNVKKAELAPTAADKKRKADQLVVKKKEKQ